MSDRQATAAGMRGRPWGGEGIKVAMTLPVIGPGTPFVSLLDEDAGPGLPLPAAFRQAYGGD